MASTSRDIEILSYERGQPSFAVGANPVYGACVAIAARIPAWIVARKTNQASFQYVGRADYRPKEISCKPKTADRNNPMPWVGDVRVMQTAGLVVDPFLCPLAFSTTAKLNDAKKWWTEFARAYLKRDLYGYRINNKSGTPHFGCLMRDHQFIHGDLDLFDVVKASTELDERRFKETIHKEDNVFTALTRIAGNLIDNALGCEMVLHGAQLHYGDWDEKGVLVFPPKGSPFELATVEEQQRWYALRWPGRVPVAAGGAWLRKPQKP